MLMPLLTPLTSQKQIRKRLRMTRLPQSPAAAGLEQVNFTWLWRSTHLMRSSWELVPHSRAQKVVHHQHGSCGRRNRHSVCRSDRPNITSSSLRITTLKQLAWRKGARQNSLPLVHHNLVKHYSELSLFRALFSAVLSVLSS